ncbi:MAG: hypothetical protein NXI32_05055 [bacterium]|nr:hypothetical protein [bacterium]
MEIVYEHDEYEIMVMRPDQGPCEVINFDGESHYGTLPRDVDERTAALVVRWLKVGIDHGIEIGIEQNKGDIRKQWRSLQYAMGLKE